MTLTPRGWAVVYLITALLLGGLVILADHAMSIPGVDDAVVDATQLQ